MTKTKKSQGLLPKIEMIIVGIFFLGFILLMIPKCESASKNNIASTEQVPTPTIAVLDTLKTSPPVTNLPLASTKERTILYVIIENVNMREQPHLVGTIIQKLKLHEEVFFFGEMTEKTQKIDWGNHLVTDEPWLKIQTKDGRTGWVYGAGLHFYKKTFEALNTKQE